MFLISDDLLVKSYNDNPFDEIFRRPYVIPCRPSFLWPYYHFILHCIPGYVIDTVVRLSGRKPM